MSRPLPTHPFFHAIGRVPITIIRDTCDRTDLELLAIDCFGTKRPEQAYAFRTVKENTHLYTAISPVGQFTKLQCNVDAATRDNKPYTLPLSTKKNTLYLTGSEQLAQLFHLVVKTRTGTAVHAEIISAQVAVTPRYLPPPQWFTAEQSAVPALDHEAGNDLHPERRIRLLSLGESREMQRATETNSIGNALYLMNALPSLIAGSFFEDKSVPAIFSWTNTSGVQSFSDHRIGPLANAGISAGVRRFTHRTNSHILNSALGNKQGPDPDTVREIVHSVQGWSTAYRAA